MILLGLLSLQYKEAYDRELMQHGNTMQELVMVKQQLESEQESLAEVDEAVKIAEEKLAANDVSVKNSIWYVHMFLCVYVSLCVFVCVYVSLCVCVCAQCTYKMYHGCTHVMFCLMALGCMATENIINGDRQ